MPGAEREALPRRERCGSVGRFPNDGIHATSEGAALSAAEAQYAVAAAETLLSFLSGFGEEPAKPRPPAESFATITVIEGLDHFMRFLADLVQEPLIDRVDASFVDFQVSTDILNSPYWRILRDRVGSGSMRVRRVATMSTPLKSAWLLLKIIPDHGIYLGRQFRLAVFRAALLNGRTNIALPGIAALYSSKDPSLGFALVDYIGPDDDQQRFVFLSGVEILTSVKHAYAHWFRNAEEIVPGNAGMLFHQCYPESFSHNELKRLVVDYASELDLDDDAIRSAIEYWTAILDRTRESFGAD